VIGDDQAGSLGRRIQQGEDAALDALGGVDVPHEFPSSVESEAGWANAFAFTSGTLLFTAQEAGALSDATLRYWGSRKASVRAMESMSTSGAPSAFLHYAFEDFRTDPDSPTAAERVIEKASQHPDFSADELRCYEARRDVVVSLFEVSPGGLKATDLLTQEEFMIDIDFDHATEREGQALLLRRYQLGPFHAFAIAGFPVEAAAKGELLAELAGALGAAPTHELLRTKGHAIGALWLSAMKRLALST